MGLLGISFIVASVVYVLVRPPSWLSQRISRWPFLPVAITDVSKEAAIVDSTAPSIPASASSAVQASLSPDSVSNMRSSDLPVIPPPPWSPTNGQPSTPATTPQTDASKSASDTAAMPPPPLPTIIDPPVVERDCESPTTPKASASKPLQAVTSFSLSADPPAPSLFMPPPPKPSPQQTSSAGRVPTLPMFPAANSAQRARGPAPNRAPPGLSPGGGLAPPPTHSSKPQKPSRKVTLDPGHSPLDWARISGPNSDLRGVEPSTPYLRVTPSMLKKQSGRRGKDAWMALNGKVYNVTPYAKFHPGGVPELMRGAARDGTRLFGEVHPWVNYETMLSSCLVGLLVEEPEGGSQASKMDEMD
ncbi:Cytochrome b5 [Moelleriella libera RCEF 2490]|uniref:Cytochrome b5 n=1 Tax=Moelleriella libera RCEF 2490 TaxID=1081109 RepID=A0A166UGF0_9HYPO|nr:Cytochrome b5 [Moelleriella libera RCEF 2490]